MSERMIRLMIDGEPITVLEGTTVLQAAARLGIEIPTLCYLEGVTEGGGCRICQVSVTAKGSTSLRTACNEPVSEGMEVRTDSQEARQARRTNLEFLLSRHLHSCFNCDRHPSCYKSLFPYCNYDNNCFTCGERENCKLRKYAIEAGIITPSLPNLAAERQVITDNPVVRQDPNRCVLCRRCRATCSSVTEGLISIENRGVNSLIRLPAGQEAIACISCGGACAANCPTGALQRKNRLQETKILHKA